MAQPPRRGIARVTQFPPIPAPESVPENHLVNATVSTATIDPSPLRVSTDDTVQGVVEAMAMAVKTYALVYGGEALAGVFCYANAARATAELADFKRAIAGQWMTPPQSAATPESIPGLAPGPERPVSQSALSARY
ncbi:hypothetical protein VB780_19810 [Leptolyngbya sp. CCNP1308]|uniref:hypothetical protein n=1 Tax=Leptolyngbya sp. CCNP1308 TaxID=3110255 RepID=UPI002B2021BE|nr:hypothetical protein [Leptolyngbya sp. CCNP1308]MEA5450836.1 hypothetical protein [Leptolyngbya sp. CCNP1308]